MNENINRFFVLTGGPGSGKSSLVDALQQRGNARSVEAGRAIIQDQMAIGGRALPWVDPILLAELMLAWEMRSYRIAQDQAARVFFDRGVPDVVGYLATDATASSGAHAESHAGIPLQPPGFHRSTVAGNLFSGPRAQARLRRSGANL